MRSIVVPKKGIVAAAAAAPISPAAIAELGQLTSMGAEEGITEDGYAAKPTHAVPYGSMFMYAWGFMLLLAAALHTTCGYSGVPALVRMYERDPSGLEHVMREWSYDWCPQVPTISAISPHTFAWYLAVLGPLPMWLLLAWHLYSNARPRQAPILILTIQVFLAIVMPIRYLYKVSSFDPSGHTLVFGMQLLPLAMVIDEELILGSYQHTRSPSWLPLKLAVGYAAILVWFSAFSVFFFHEPLEVLVVWSFVALTQTLWKSPAVNSAPVTTQMRRLWQLSTVSATAWAMGLLWVFGLIAWGYRLRPVAFASACIFDAIVFILQWLVGRFYKHTLGSTS